MVDWNATFAEWAKPLSASDEERAANAERMIRDAVRVAAGLSPFNVEVFLQGSYRNNTNIRGTSDIDVVVRATNVVMANYEFAPSASHATVGLSATALAFSDMKDALGAALRQKFGDAGVQRGNKAFRLVENSYRLVADVVPTWEYRRYEGPGPQPVFHKGTWFEADDGTEIVNYPEQHYANGVAKRERTGHRFKRVVRILKTANTRLPAAQQVTSFEIECLAYAAADGCYNRGSLRADVREVVRDIYYLTITPSRYGEAREISGLKWLYQGTDRSPAHAAACMVALWTSLDLDL